MESQPHPLVGQVEPSKAVVEQSACDIQQVSIPPADDDPSKRPSLSALKSWSVGLDHGSSLGIHPQGESLTSEPMYRDRDLDVLQKRP